MASTRLLSLTLSLVAVLLVALYLISAVRPAALCTPYADRPPPALAVALPAALPPPRGDGALDRRAQWNPHAAWPGHDGVDGGGTYCGAVAKLLVTAEAGPPASDCEAIRVWAADDANHGYFHATIERLNAAPWVLLVSAGSCAVAVGTDYHEAYRDGLLVGTADVAALLAVALGEYAGLGDHFAWRGAWVQCASPAFDGAGLDAWPAKFRITHTENLA